MDQLKPQEIRALLLRAEGLSLSLSVSLCLSLEMATRARGVLT